MPETTDPVEPTELEFLPEWYPRRRRRRRQVARAAAIAAAVLALWSISWFAV